MGLGAIVINMLRKYIVKIGRIHPEFVKIHDLLPPVVINMISKVAVQKRTDYTMDF